MILQGKSVLITGAAKRIGAVIARKLAGAGCRVIIHCHNSVSKAEELLSTLPGNGHRIITADLSNEKEVHSLAENAGDFELLVNSAAIFHRPGSPEDAAAAGLYHQINFAASKILLDHLFHQDLPEAAAVNITDIYALLPGNGAYYQSKKALNELTVSLAPVWAEKNFRINAVAPGPMIPPPWAPDSRMEKTLPMIPLKRAVCPEDLAETVKFLLACDSITGAIIPVDCGISTKK